MTKKNVFVALVFCLCCFVVVSVVFHTQCHGEQAQFHPIIERTPGSLDLEVSSISGYVRPEETTYLTLPEWYLVFNPQEYGQFIANNRPSTFDYLGSVGQFWYGYCQVYGITYQHYPFNSGYHLMNVVIGTSFSVEYATKGVWENTVGWLSEWMSGGQQTQEDLYAAQVAQQYGAFIPNKPWFEFPFGEKLIGLWTQTDIFGPNFLRKVERKFFLSVEYGVKMVYAYIMGLGSRITYGSADTEVVLVVRNVTESIFLDERVKKVKEIGEDFFVISLPHYQGFTDIVPLLAQQGVEFVDIAGNNEIAVTVVATKDWDSSQLDGIATLFTMNTMGSKDMQRVVLQVPVAALSDTLNQLMLQGVTIEHLYDY